MLYMTMGLVSVECIRSTVEIILTTLVLYILALYVYVIDTVRA